MQNRLDERARTKAVVAALNKFEDDTAPSRCSSWPEHLGEMVDAAITSYLQALPQEGWRPIEAWATFHGDKILSITLTREIAEVYARNGIDTRQLAASPAPPSIGGEP